MGKDSTCDACGKEILFLKTESDTWFPVEREQITIVTAKGQIFYGYQSHWETCRKGGEMEASKELVAKDQHQLTKKDIDDWLLGSDTKLTEKQKALFYQVALSFQLNPAKREIYAIAYGNNFNVITGYEVYLKRAERTGKLEYWKADVVKENDEWIGRCTVKRTDRTEPTTIEAWFNEYNQGNRMWKEKPRTMIRKVAIAQAFRMSFPDELGGMPYTSDEMGDVIEVKVVEEKKEKQGSPSKKEKSSHQEALTQSDKELMINVDQQTAIKDLCQEKKIGLRDVLLRGGVKELSELTAARASKCISWLESLDIQDIPM